MNEDRRGEHRALKLNSPLPYWPSLKKVAKTGPILALNRRRKVGIVSPLQFLWQLEEVAGDLSSAIRAPTFAVQHPKALPGELIHCRGCIVDGQLFAGLYVSGGIDILHPDSFHFAIAIRIA